VSAAYAANLSFAAYGLTPAFKRAANTRLRACCAFESARDIHHLWRSKETEAASMSAKQQQQNPQSPGEPDKILTGVKAIHNELVKQGVKWSERQTGEYIKAGLFKGAVVRLSHKVTIGTPNGLRDRMTTLIAGDDAG
jgi:hypothetical protein